MLKYELLMLARPDITQEKQDEIREWLEKIISDHAGSTFVYDKWGKYLLAYPIQKNSYGVYTLMRFSVPTEHMKDTLVKLRTACSVKFNGSIMRFVFADLSSTASTHYCKPDSLEDAPRRERSYNNNAWFGKVPADHSGSGQHTHGTAGDDLADVPHLVSSEGV